MSPRQSLGSTHLGVLFRARRWGECIQRLELEKRRGLRIKPEVLQYSEVGKMSRT